MDIPQYFSHVRTDSEGQIQAIQSNENHCTNVAQLCKVFANKFGMPLCGSVVGMCHDKGKERTSFQSYIKRESGYDTTIRHIGEHTHAYVGGIVARRWYGKTLSQSLLVNPIISHHSGLHDYDTIDNAISDDKMPSEIQVAEAPIVAIHDLLEEIKTACGNSSTVHFHHLPRMLFSCLVDADRLDTEAFMDRTSSLMRSQHSTLAQLSAKLEAYLEQLAQNAPDTPVNRIRAKVQEQCKAMAEGPQGCYSLTVPTGGGKTLSSLVWAMRHAMHHGLERIIIAIPYTSIIAQTAEVLRGIFGQENVLEHHSNVNYDHIKKDKNLLRRLEMACENWDYPIVVTTNVQLFESIYANSPSACRKLHNICRSVLILDEVQTLPTDFLEPIVNSLKAYQKLFGVSILLTTASQPILSGLIEGCNPNAKFVGIGNICEIIPQEYRLHEELRRVNLEVDYTPLSYDELAQKIASHDKVLCIVNTRRDAKEIYGRLPHEGITLHLSRMMCSEHIAQTIADIRQALASADNRVIRIIATQLIEAGVDIDFPIVYRQEAGLDSVLQAAGRCNREGKLPVSTTHVFSLAKERPLPPGTITSANNAMRNIAGITDWFTPLTMTEYFRQLYCRTQTFDKKDICTKIEKPDELQYEAAAKAFRLIDDNSISIIVNWGESASLIERIKQGEMTYDLMKRLSRYSVGVRERDFNNLHSYGVVEEVKEGLYFISDTSQYSHDIGLHTDNHWMDEILVL